MISTLESRDGELITVNGEIVVLIESTDQYATSVLTTSQESILNTEAAPSTSVVETVSTPGSVLETIGVMSSVIETSPPQGEKGEPGTAAGMIIEYPIEYPVSGHRIVVLNADSKVIYADNTEPTHANKVLGMTTGAATVGDVPVQRGGRLIEPSWSWILDTPIWLSSSGLMTQTPPSTGFSMIVGFPITATEIFIGIREPLFLI